MSSAVGIACDLLASSRREDAASTVQRPIASACRHAPALEPMRPAGCGAASSSSSVRTRPDVFASADDDGNKRRRLDTAHCAFSIPNNDDDPAAENPPLFRKHALREEQLRSLGWMLSQEKLQGSLRGGLLADRMGFGKTSIAIGLTSLEVRPCSLPARSLPASSGYIPASGTLIMCPSHLIDQWEEEFWKFLGSDGVQLSKVASLEHNLEEVMLRLRSSDMKAESGYRLGIEVAGEGDEGVAITHMSSSSEKSINAAARELRDEARVPRVGDRIKKIRCSHTDDGSRIRAMTIGSTQALKDFLHPPRSRRKGKAGAKVRAAKLTAESVIDITFKLESREEPRTTVTRGKGPLKVLIVRESSEMHRLQQQDLLQFNVVLASTGIHSDQRYAGYVTEAASSTGQSCYVMAKKITVLPAFVKERSKTARSFQMLLHRSPALFELNSWHRVVLDEFHESEAWEYRVREMLRGLTAKHKWGLSGTPPMDTALAVVQIAALLGFISEDETEGEDLMSEAKRRSTHMHVPETQAWFDRKEASLMTATKEFVDKFIRQNTSALVEKIGVKEHEQMVEHTYEERLIYRQACHDQGIFDLADGYTHISLKARKELLKRCAHFDMGKADSADSAVLQLGQSKRSWLSRVEAQLYLELARAGAFGCWTQELKTELAARLPSLHAEVKSMVEPLLAMTAGELQRKMVRDIDPSDNQRPEAAALQMALRLSVTSMTADGELRLRPLACLQQPVPESEYFVDDSQRHLVVHSVARKAKHGEADDALCDLAICRCDDATPKQLRTAFAKGILELVSLLDKAQRSLQFYEQQLGQLQSSERSERECSICLEPMNDLSTAAILPCSHVFHMHCVRDVLARIPNCPECRAPLQPSRISSVVMELKKPEPQPVQRAMSRAWKRHGSKLNAVAAKLKEIRQSDPSAKALVFVQWVDLEAKACRALQDHGVPFLHLSNLLEDVRKRKQLALQDGQVLRRFQEESGPDAPFALVLSLQRAASGTNLTAASHVLFVHPMNAESIETAAAYERQALGRVRRIGQSQQSINVWRFITKDTVEEHICKLHKKAATSTSEQASVDEISS
ncbi:Hltf [Symbiodinium sp. CCMP2456]|nr:Hltf [Symbiodinium sp. CCMP2456]